MMKVYVVSQKVKGTDEFIVDKVFLEKETAVRYCRGSLRCESSYYVSPVRGYYYGQYIVVLVEEKEVVE